MNDPVTTRICTEHESRSRTAQVGPHAAVAESVDALHARIGRLQLERQELREREASRSELEQNRAGLVRCQWQLAHALIARYCSPAFPGQAA